MSEKLGRVMYQIDASYHVLWTEREIAERPEIPFRPVHVFTPEELRELLEEAFKAGRCDNDGGNVQIDYNDGHGFKYPRFANFLAERGLGGKEYEVPQELR